MKGGAPGVQDEIRLNGSKQVGAEHKRGVGWKDGLCGRTRCIEFGIRPT